VHLTLGILRKSQAVSYALSFFQLDGFAVPTPAQVTQTVVPLPCKKRIATFYRMPKSIQSLAISGAAKNENIAARTASKVFNIAVNDFHSIEN